MKKILLLLGSLLLTLAVAVPAMAADYDLVILNGRVMDPEINFDRVCNFGIKDGVQGTPSLVRFMAKFIFN